MIPETHSGDAIVGERRTGVGGQLQQFLVPMGCAYGTGHGDSLIQAGGSSLSMHV